MPSLGQNLWFGYYDVPLKDRLRAVKAAGFDDVMMWWVPAELARSNFRGTIRDGRPEEIYDQVLAAGLDVKTAHFPTWHTEWQWMADERGEKWEEQFREALRACGERGIGNLVVHTTRKLETPPPNETGLERMKRLCAAAEEAGVNIAVENTRFLEYNRFYFDRIHSPRLGFCYDCGHEHCFTFGRDVLGEFGSRMVTMHLHDNFGPSEGDAHAMPGEGDIDFDSLSPRLKALEPSSYNLESQCVERDERHGIGMEKYLEMSYAALRAIVECRPVPRIP